MPCDDGRGYERVIYQESGTQTARLCAVFTVLERQGILKQILEQADWKEAGVSLKGTLEWWARHKEEDRRRREREVEQARIKRRRAEALSRISEADKKLLGLK